jgi:hypothetical protein
VSSDQFIDQSAFNDCSFTGSASVTTPGPSGDQIFDGTAFADAQPGVWKVAYDLTVSNYMRDMYQYSSTTTTNQTVPTTAVAGAELTDTLTVSRAGGPGVYNLSYIFSLDGTLTSTNQSLFSASFCVSLFLPEGTGTATSICLSPGQTVPSTFTLTYSDLPFGGPVDPTLFIEALGDIAPLDPSQVGTPIDTIINGAMHVNFGSTVHLNDVLITDSNGDPIPGVQISSSTGITYPLDSANVAPEPGWLALPGLGVLFALYRRRRSQ